MIEKILVINFEPIKILKNWRYMMKFTTVGDCTSSSIDTQLNVIYLRTKKVKKKSNSSQLLNEPEK